MKKSLVNSELRWRCTSVLDDDNEKITAAIGSMLDQGMDMVICTGGMSVDPDDKTPLAIKNSGAKVVSYGAPVLPGAMFLLAYYRGWQAGNGPAGLRDVCQDVQFLTWCCPVIMADVPITRGTAQPNCGEGGLCLGCAQVHLPQLRLWKVGRKMTGIYTYRRERECRYGRCERQKGATVRQAHS